MYRTCYNILQTQVFISCISSQEFLPSSIWSYLSILSNFQDCSLAALLLSGKKTIKVTSFRGHWCTGNGMDCSKELPLIVCSSFCDLEKRLSSTRTDLLKPRKVESFVCLFVCFNFWDSTQSKRFTNFSYKTSLCLLHIYITLQSLNKHKRIDCLHARNTYMYIFFKVGLCVHEKDSFILPCGDYVI